MKLEKLSDGSYMILCSEMQLKMLYVWSNQATYIDRQLVADCSATGIQDLQKFAKETGPLFPSFTSEIHSILRKAVRGDEV